MSFHFCKVGRSSSSSGMPGSKDSCLFFAIGKAQVCHDILQPSCSSAGAYEDDANVLGVGIMHSPLRVSISYRILILNDIFFSFL